ncbi:Opine oxidase subunit A [Hyphomicrobiales bacterium]|nr:Opine oxidase subunit A [Hyphomicrobiales bacterium]CAH1693191.1 Opine oxidase subunit A [Hyphomicrobiales bacterium]
MSGLRPVVIIGAGPAGMAAAITLRQFDIPVVVVDEQMAPGGQIWRAVTADRPQSLSRALGQDYSAGLGHVRQFLACGAEMRFGTAAWQIEPEWRVFLRKDGNAEIQSFSQVLLATGAQERPAPFPGWTLPGVVSVGGAQIMLKTSGQIPSGPVWVAGSGPLPLLYIMQIMRLGVRPAGFLDTTPLANRRTALAQAASAARGWRDLAKGAAWLGALRRSGVPIIKDVAALRAVGDGRLTAVRYRSRRGEEREVSAAVLLVHEGVVPAIHATQALGCEHRWHDQQLCMAPVLDAWSETSRQGLFVAGDGADIGGARAAWLRGQVAGIGIAFRRGCLDLDQAERHVAPVRRKLDQALASRRFLDALFRPRPEIFAPDDETIICRCEEVTAGCIRELAIGEAAPNQIKAHTRIGMGPCQGRQCGYSLSHILAAAQQRPVADIGFMKVRPPLRPISFSELAGLQSEEPAP